jgi:hypothetical protein
MMKPSFQSKWHIVLAFSMLFATLASSVVGLFLDPASNLNAVEEADHDKPTPLLRGLATFNGRVTGLELWDTSISPGSYLEDVDPTRIKIIETSKPSFSINAIVEGSIGSVIFRIDGQYQKTENIYPYTLCGDGCDGVNLKPNPCLTDYGRYVISAQACSEFQGGGECTPEFFVTLQIQPIGFGKGMKLEVWSTLRHPFNLVQVLQPGGSHFYREGGITGGSFTIKAIVEGTGTAHFWFMRSRKYGGLTDDWKNCQEYTDYWDACDVKNDSSQALCGVHCDDGCDLVPCFGFGSYMVTAAVCSEGHGGIYCSDPVSFWFIADAPKGP